MSGLATGTAGELLGRQRERAAIEQMISSLGEGHSAALVIRGEPGAGKSVLLDHVAARAERFRVARLSGIESEMELAYAGLRELCGPFLDRLDRLAEPQRNALGAAFGLTTGPPPDALLVALATLSLLADAAEDGPIVCLVDDAQWLDRVSLRALGFVGRRLDMDGLALVAAVREPSLTTELSGLPEAVLEGLGDDDARTLLDSVIKGPIDERVRTRIIAEARGNPLALLELPRAWTAAEMAEGLWAANALPVVGRVEQGYVRRLDSLPDEAARLLRLAAAEPLGDPTLLWAAAERLGIGPDAEAAALTSGLIEFSPRVRFRHPLVRSVAYRTAPEEDRKAVHAALAEVTDPELNPDRRAWHRAGATGGVDEEVAGELEQAAKRSRARGGSAAAAAFLERAASLTPDPASRADRLLAAAGAKHAAGALTESLALLTAVAAGPPSAVRDADAESLRGQIAFDERRTGDAARLLAHAAEQYRPLDEDRAHRTFLNALGAALWASGPGSPSHVVEIAQAARVRTAPGPADTDRPLDLLLEALAARFTEGYTAAADRMRAALIAVRDMTLDAEDVTDWLWLAGNRGGGLIALELWDLDSAVMLATRQVDLSRRAGAQVKLQFALNFLGSTYLLSGDLGAAQLVIDEDRLVAQVIGSAPVGYLGPWYLALRGREREATRSIDDLVTEATSRSLLRMLDFASYYRGVLYNGLGRPGDALASLAPVFERDVVGYFAFLVPELAEAAARADDRSVLDAVVRRMAERADSTRSEWLSGMYARVRALAGGDDTDDLYRESVDRLGRTRLRAEVGRGHLLYGEWLRRQGRRVDARRELRTAYNLLASLGLDAFAERARRELRATGTAVQRNEEASPSSLTAQESLIARLAGDGLSNTEIGQRLFLSPRTVEWHLRKIFAKLDITSRRRLRGVKLEA